MYILENISRVELNSTPEKFSHYILLTITIDIFISKSIDFGFKIKNSMNIFKFFIFVIKYFIVDKKLFFWIDYSIDVISCYETFRIDDIVYISISSSGCFYKKICLWGKIIIDCFFQCKISRWFYNTGYIFINFRFLINTTHYILDLLY